MPNVPEDYTHLHAAPPTTDASQFTQLQKVHQGIYVLMQRGAVAITAEHEEIWIHSRERSLAPDALTSQDRAWLDYFGWVWDEDVEAWHRYV